MGKRRQFKEDEVLAQISEYFWEHGYAATTVDKLASLTGLTKTSLYNAFGNKEALYLKSLDFYLARAFGDSVKQLDFDKRMSDNLEYLFNKFFIVVDAKELSYGCLVVNSLLEFASNDSSLYLAALQRFEIVRGEIHAFFERYVLQNRLTSNMTADELTDLFAIFYQGLRVQSRIADSEATLHRSIKTFLDLMRTLEKMP